MKKLKKGSIEAKAYMAKIRSMRKGSKPSYKHDVLNYKYFVVSTDGEVSSGWEYRDDAVDQMNEHNADSYKGKKWKVASLKTLKSMGINDPREEWSMSGLDRVNKRKTTTYLHYTRAAKKAAKKVAKKASRKTSVKRKRVRSEKTTLLPLSYLNYGDTFTKGASGVTIYERGSLVGNNMYEVSSLNGKKQIMKGSTRVNLIASHGVSGYVHTKRHGRKTTTKYTHAVKKRISGVSTPSKSHTDYNSPEVNIQIGMAHDNMNMVSKHMHSIATLTDKLNLLQHAKKFQPTALKKLSDKQIAFIKKNIASYKKQISELKKHI